MSGGGHEIDNVITNRGTWIEYIRRRQVRGAGGQRTSKRIEDDYLLSCDVLNK